MKRITRLLMKYGHVPPCTWVVGDYVFTEDVLIGKVHS
jgi:hypothetical protein